MVGVAGVVCLVGFGGFGGFVGSLWALCAALSAHAIARRPYYPTNHTLANPDVRLDSPLGRS